MNTCTLTKTSKFQSLKDMAKISQFNLEAAVQYWVEKYNRFPYLDEMDGTNSEPYLLEKLKSKQVKKGLYIKLDDLFNYTETDSIELAAVKLNDIHRDLIIDISQISDTKAVISIKHRPQFSKNLPIQQVTDIDTTNIKQALINRFETLQDRFGIKINTITTEELKNLDIPNVHLANAFIYNGEIYINSDRANIDAPIHELLHMILGSVKFTNPELYYGLVQQVQSIPNYITFANQYPGRTQNDVLEEVFVDQFAKFLTGLDSMFKDFNENIIYNIFYETNRVLDSLLEGDITIKQFPKSQIYTSTLSELCKLTNSKIFNNNKSVYHMLDLSALNRICANVKEQALKSGELIEQCV